MILAIAPIGVSIWTSGGFKKLGMIAQDIAKSGAVTRTQRSAGKYANTRRSCSFKFQGNCVTIAKTTNEQSDTSMNGVGLRKPITTCLPTKDIILSCLNTVQQPRCNENHRAATSV